MSSEKLADIESSLLLEAVYRRYGYDFRSYTFPGMQKRLEAFVQTEHLNSVSDMIPRLLHDNLFFNRLLSSLLVTVTDFFRDPDAYKSLKENVMPALRTYPYINVWCAGCATGEEAYSVAIMLKEAGLLGRSQIYATDINNKSLSVGKEGIYSLKRLGQNADNYRLAGGAGDFSQYYTTKYNAFKMDKELRERILFSRHNLVNDGAFAEMHLVFCRNVCIYFNEKLQTHVVRLFHKSLVRNGFLFMGESERIDYETSINLFELIKSTSCVYKRQ
ncbi:MAG: protein-glutamate O-methyltransferase CheR [Bacteroides sp.]|jgi:chemotaxis protein methyltransferase CheR|nr:protein-glutamate O-methyltransferase CheR [Bacteroides sp.]